jgi:hypothetical protein
MPARDTEVLTRQDQGRQVKHAAFIKEKIMASKSGFKQTSVPATLLWSAVLAIALIVSASPASSKTLDLACTYKGEGSGHIRLRIDTDRSSLTAVANFANWPVVITWPRGDSRYKITTLSDQLIKFTDKWKGDYTEGTLNRIAGTLDLYDFRNGLMMSPSHWACRRATQKF